MSSNSYARDALVQVGVRGTQEPTALYCTVPFVSDLSGEGRWDKLFLSLSQYFLLVWQYMAQVWNWYSVMVCETVV